MRCRKTVIVENEKRVALWDNIKFILIYLVVAGHFASFYLEQSWNVKRLCLLIYFFHMPAFIFISGLFSKKTVDQKNFRKVFEYLVLYIFSKIYLFLAKIVCGYGIVEISLLSEGGVPWYAFALAVYVLLMICLKDLDKKYQFVFSVVLACFAGYASDVGKELVLSRIIVYYPFFLAGYCMDHSTISQKFRSKKARVVSLLFVISFMIVTWLGIKKLHWLLPLLSGQNSYESLGEMADWGGILRAVYYLPAFGLIFALISLAPAGKSIITRLGSRSVWVYVLHYTAVYIYFGKFNGMQNGPIWTLPVALLTTVICALPFWDRILGGLIKPRWEKREHINVDGENENHIKNQME